MCGEQQKVMQLRTWLIGSPPRVRGTVIQPPPSWRCSRITPACAGNSQPRHGDVRQQGDHPRVCGEQCSKRRQVSRGLGSPPRVRGTDTHYAYAGQQNRITPACAGNSPPVPCPAISVWDHPRVCGEQTLWRHEPNIKQGSPPRVRGTEAASQ